MGDYEFEVKYYISDPDAIRQKALDLGAELIQPRTHEYNLRLDTPDGELSRKNQVLRLRQDSDAHLTYKGPGKEQNGVRVRQEFEFIVSDFLATQKLFEQLGFHVLMIYEKFRTTYDLDKVHLTLDQMPYGNFIEIEGPDADSVQKLNEKLELNWEARIPVSYTVLFEQVKIRLGLSFRDLIFDNFENLNLMPEDLGVTPADG